MNMVKDMQVNCSNCNTNYSMSNTQLKNLDNSVLTCKKCKRYIKITFCPSCRAFYSISFKTVENPQYNMRCRRCHTTFTVDFPVVNREKKTYNSGISPLFDKRENEEKVEGSTAGTVETQKLRDREEQASKPAPQLKKPVESFNNEKTGIHFKGKTLEGYNLKELLVICGSAFSIPKLIAASTGVITAIAIFALYEWLESAVIGDILTSDDARISSFMNLFPLALIFFVFIQVSALISRITLERIFFNRVLGAVRSLGFVARTWFPVFASNILILVVLNTVISLFGNIPVVGPILYSLMFLPLYLVSLVILFLVSFGFWFYPPVIAYRRTGVVDNAKNFWHFLKKHNFTLVYIVPILVMITSIVFAAIYFFHTGALSLSLLITDGSGGESVSGLLASIPSNLLRISELSFLGNGMGRFKDLVSGLVFSQHAGGFFVGLVLASLSVVLISSFISVVSTLSTHVYILMERGVDIDDRKKFRLLGILVLLLAGIMLVKKLLV